MKNAILEKPPSTREYRHWTQRYTVIKPDKGEGFAVEALRSKVLLVDET